MFLSKRKTLIKTTAGAIAFLFVHLQIVQYPLKTALASEGVSKVAIFVFPKSSKDAQPAMMLQGLLRNQVKRIKNARCADTSPIQNLAGLSELPSLLNEGRLKLASDNPSSAEFTFRRAAQIAEAALGGVSRELLARIYKGLGIALIFSGDNVRGKQMINRSLNLYKNQDALQYNYRLDVKTAFEQVAADIESKAAGSLTINSMPAGAEVYLADEFRGFTPVTLTNLAAGEHLVKVQKDGFYNFAKFIEVAPGASAAYEVVLTATLDKKSYDEYIAKVDKDAAKGKKSTELILLREVSGATDVIALEAGFSKGAFSLKGVHLKGDEAVPVSFTLKQDATILDSSRSFLAATLNNEVVAEAKD
ncbi:MAG: PEGA domain-containing protein, partial [Deltaproteobacteria bacterium]|nr:PEGA domain-containing protein [Deltaproteobacteria bacterium]